MSDVEYLLKPEADNRPLAASFDFIKEMSKAAIVTPVEGATQLAKHVVGMDSTLAAPGQQEPLTSSGRLGRDVGSALPFIAVAVGSHRLMPKVESRLATFGTGAALGFGYDMLAHPVYGKDNENFWANKAKNGTVSALTVGTMFALSPLQMTASESRLGNIGRGAWTGFYTGFGGGVVNAEANSLLSGKGFADPAKVLESGLTFGTGGAAFGGAFGAMAKVERPSNEPVKGDAGETPWFRRTKPDGSMETHVAISGDGKSVVVIDEGWAATFKDGKWNKDIGFQHEQLAEFSPVQDPARIARIVEQAQSALSAELAGGAKPAAGEVPWFRRTTADGLMEPHVTKGPDGSLVIINGDGWAATFKDGKWNDNILFSHDQLSKFSPVTDQAEIYRVVKQAKDALNAEQK